MLIDENIIFCPIKYIHRKTSNISKYMTFQINPKLYYTVYPSISLTKINATSSLNILKGLKKLKANVHGKICYW